MELQLKLIKAIKQSVNIKSDHYLVYRNEDELLILNIAQHFKNPYYK